MRSARLPSLAARWFLMADRTRLKRLCITDLTGQARLLLRDEEAHKELLTRAQTELEDMRGALDATLTALEAYLPDAKEKRRAS